MKCRIWNNVNQVIFKISEKRITSKGLVLVRCITISVCAKSSFSSYIIAYQWNRLGFGRLKTGLFNRKYTTVYTTSMSYIEFVYLSSIVGMDFSYVWWSGKTSQLMNKMDSQLISLLYPLNKMRSQWGGKRYLFCLFQMQQSNTLAWFVWLRHFSNFLFPK